MTTSTCDLHHLVRLPTGTGQAAPVLFLFHGFGSNERDLHGLSDHIPADWLVVTVRGPITVGPNQFKWFEVARTAGKMIVDVASEGTARRHLQGFIDQIVAQHGADASRIVVAGFSQGAALSLNLFLKSPDKYLAVGAFGGRVMDEIKPQIVGTDALLAKPVFLGFGTQDPFISQRQAADTQTYLRNLGLIVDVSKDDVGHTISVPQWVDFVRFLEALRTD